MRRKERFGLKTSGQRISHDQPGAGGKPVTDRTFPLIPNSRDLVSRGTSILPLKVALSPEHAAFGSTSPPHLSLQPLLYIQVPKQLPNGEPRCNIAKSGVPLAP
jgi:hypothetical protein